ncbi:MAG: hypothetical protein M1828_001687 [Chrysothrix sp. TS-e1954]|nr:MAG: hypothetical protein M1828_001687 [Chrysothrix sp. TS-e1954]
MANLLAQRKEIKRVERLDGSNLAAAAVEEAREDDEARRRAVDDFEKVQAGLAAKPMTSKQGQQRSSSEVPQPSDDALDLRSSDGQAKRKLDLEEKDFSDFREEDRAKARKSLRDQKLQDAKSALPSFWVPSLTPDQRQNQTQVAPQYAAGTSRRSTASQQPLCPCSTADTAHHFSLKTLVTVKFSEEDKSSQSRHHEAVEDSRKQQTRICPACNRQLSNASKAMLTKPCGHVLCGQCTTRFVLDSQHTDVHEILKQDTQSARCFVCHEDVSARQPGKDPSMGKVQRGLVEISSDGTGFAKGGRSLIKKVGVAFQC